MFQRSEGSAPAQFVLIAAPLTASFALVLALALIGYEKAMLTAAVTRIAERTALADVGQEESEQVVTAALTQIGLTQASISLSREGSEQVARGTLALPGGLEIEAIGLASLEN